MFPASKINTDKLVIGVGSSTKGIDGKLLIRPKFLQWLANFVIMNFSYMYACSLLPSVRLLYIHTYTCTLLFSINHSLTNAFPYIRQSELELQRRVSKFNFLNSYLDVGLIVASFPGLDIERGLIYTVCPHAQNIPSHTTML